MSNMIKLGLALILTVAALFGEQIVEVIKNNVEIVNTPSVDVDEPALEYKTLVESIVNMDIKDEDARQMSDFFLELSNVVWTDPGFIESTGQFRDFNVKSGGLNFAGLELKDKYPQLGEKIDKAIIDTVGVEDSELTEKKRKDLCDCLNAVAWGVHQ